jgi:hypothetical protein
VVLHAERGKVPAPEAFHHVIVEIDVGDVRFSHGPIGHGEVVVLAGDLDPAGGQPADGVIPPWWPNFNL